MAGIYSTECTQMQRVFIYDPFGFGLYKHASYTATDRYPCKLYSDRQHPANRTQLLTGLLLRQTARDLSHA